MKKIILIYVILVFVVSCTNSIKDEYVTIQSEVKDSMYVPIPTTGPVINTQFTEINGSNILVCQILKKSHYSDEIYFIDLKTKKNINTINLSEKLSSDAQLINFLYINNDSILLVYDKFKKDSTFILSDINGNIKKVYKTHNPYFNKIDSSLWVKSPFIFYDNKCFFTTSRICADIGTKEFSDEKYPIIGYLDLLKDTIVLNQELWYQNIREGLFYPWQVTILGYTISHRGTILISFANSSLLKEWNYKNNKINTFKVKSQIVDTILPEQEMFFGQQSKTQPYNGNVYYDKQNNIYVKDIWFPKNEYGEFRHISVFFDTTFSYIGESNLFYDVNNYNQQSNGWFNRVSEYNDSLKFIKTEYEFDKLDLNKILTKIDSAKQSVKNIKQEKFCSIMGGNYNFEGYSDKLMIDYTKKIFNIEDSASFSLFVITGKDCPSCDDYVLNFINMNNAVINSTGACVLFAGSNVKYFKRLIEENNLTNIQHIAVDTTGIYTDLHHFSQYNPRLLLVRENKVVSDTIYLPNDLEQMIMTYVGFYSFEVEKKTN